MVKPFIFCPPVALLGGSVRARRGVSKRMPHRHSDRHALAAHRPSRTKNDSKMCVGIDISRLADSPRWGRRVASSGRSGTTTPAPHLVSRSPSAPRPTCRTGSTQRVSVSGLPLHPRRHYSATQSHPQRTRRQPRINLVGHLRSLSRATAPSSIASIDNPFTLVDCGPPCALRFERRQPTGQGVLDPQ